MSPSRSWKAWADRDRVLAGHGVGDQQRLDRGLTMSSHLPPPRPSFSSSMASRPAVSKQDHIHSLPAGCALHGAAWRSLPAAGPATIGQAVGTSICSPRITLSCSCAAGRRTSSEAIRTRSSCLLGLSSATPILAVVVVLPEPCRPTHQEYGTGGTATRLSGESDAPSSAPPLSSLDQVRRGQS